MGGQRGRLSRFGRGDDSVSLRSRPAGYFQPWNREGLVSPAERQWHQRSIGPGACRMGPGAAGIAADRVLAFHDVRVRKDPTADPERFDQFRIPQGSLFLELYCPRTTQEGNEASRSAQFPGVSKGLYTTLNPGNETGDVALNLSRLTPADLGPQYPVWRIYISEPIDKTGGPNHKTPNQRFLNIPESNSETRFDLTYQLPMSNQMRTTDQPGGIPMLPEGTHPSGLVFDHTSDSNQRIQQPNPEQARVIVFVPDADGASAANTQVCQARGASIYQSMEISFARQSVPGHWPQEIIAWDR